MGETPFDVPIQLDKSRSIRFDGIAIARAEELTGMAFLGLLQDHAELMKLRTIMALLAAGLSHEQPGLSINQAIVLLGKSPGKGNDLTKAFAILPKILEAATQACGVEEEGESGN